MTSAGRAGVLAAMLAALSGTASGSAIDEAKALRDEGMAILKKARAPGGDVIHGSHEAIRKFEEAAAKLEGARDGSSEAELLQDINSLLFWTRRTTPLDMSAILGESGGGSGGGSRGGSRGARGEEARPPRPATRRPPPQPRPAAGAAAALEGAEAYARRHPDDLMTCAARFFEIAERYKDVHDVAFKAISRAQEFQRLASERVALREAEGKFASLGPDEKRVVEGDRAAAARKFDLAAAKYKWAIDFKATPRRRRKLGHALFGWAQELRWEYSRAYIAARMEYHRSASPYQKEAAKRRAIAAGGIAKKAIAMYSKARNAFNSALSTSPKRLDLDSELQVALTLIIRKEKFQRKKAKSMFVTILKKYHDELSTDEERTLYAFAETYAGGAAVAKVMKEIVRKRRGVRKRISNKSSWRTENVEGAASLEPSPSEMSDRELRAALREARKGLKKDEVSFKTSQLSGDFDKALLDRVNAGRKRLKELEAEASRRRKR